MRRVPKNASHSTPWPRPAPGRAAVFGAAACGLLIALAVLAPWRATLAQEGWVANAADIDELEKAFVYEEDHAELQQVWLGSMIFVPGEEMGHYIFGQLGSVQVQDRLSRLDSSIRFPLVIYLHDADGLTVVENRLLEEFEIENFAAVFPNSFARKGRRSDCDGGPCQMDPTVYLARRAELIHAVSQARRLAWVDRGNVFLVGLGEGAAAVALWGAEADVSAYAVVGWTCTAPSEAPWFDGLRLPDRPVLLLNGRSSRWAGRAGWDGRCTERAPDREGIETARVDTSVHNLFALPSGRRALIGFLQDHLKR